MKARRGMSFRKSAKLLGLLAEHSERLWSTWANMEVKHLSGDTLCRSVVTQDHGTVAASGHPYRCSKTVMAEKLKTGKVNSVAHSSDKAINQRCPSPCPRNCGCSGSIPPSLEGLTDHHAGIDGRKSPGAQGFLVSPHPQILRRNKWEKNPNVPYVYPEIIMAAAA